MATAPSGATGEAAPARQGPVGQRLTPVGLVWAGTLRPETTSRLVLAPESVLARILTELTLIHVNPEGRILRLDDPEIFNHSILYMWEPGFWVMSDEQGSRLREYLLKGGFAIFDDFEYEQWYNLEAQMRRVLPDARWVRLDASHRIFDAFFRMKDIDFPHPMYGIKPTYYGLFEDNDPAKRLMVIANHNHDVAEYWEFSDQGLWPIDLSNEAYKLGVNYMIYGLIH